MILERIESLANMAEIFFGLGALALLSNDCAVSWTEAVNAP
jgi:hypothetical protein